ncbi:MAG: hypothetical protein JZU52_11090 [Lamprocystis purpurea]|nr:hypothetical protein [Lamprocystis purpurea]
MFNFARGPRLVTITLPLLLVVGWFAFAPGLSGPFFFDDEVHLPKLAGTGDGIQTPDEVVRLILPDEGGSGRSLSYLSLLLDDNGWPSAPARFKRTNLLIHLLNSILVFAFLRGLIRLIRPAEPRSAFPDWIALATAALWLLHPLQLSPVMMVIQRMTLLGGTFSLLALIAYLHGRRIATQRHWTALFWLVPVLGILSKESAVMTLSYVLVLEVTVLGANRPPRPAWWSAWSTVFLILPLGVLAVYLVLLLGNPAAAYEPRAFNLPERLMTEGRVLMQYLRVILLPSLTESTPFRDDFTISRGLLDPPQTLVALGMIIALLTLALVKRRTWPLFSLAVLWFLLGHLLEGTVIPLEIYFEHRNYLPMIGPLFALCYIVLAVPAAYQRWTAAGLVSVIALVGTITWSSARVWGDEASIALLWSAERPASPRAQETALNFWASHGDWTRLRTQLDQAAAAQPTNANLPLYRFIVEHCSDPNLPSLDASIDEIERVARTAPLDFGSLTGIEWMTDQKQAVRCRIAPQAMERIFAGYLASPKFIASGAAHRLLATLLARYRRQQRDLDGTIRALDRAYAASPSYTTALEQAYYLMTAGLLDDAQHYVEIAAATPPKNLYEWLNKDRQVNVYQDLFQERPAPKSGRPIDSEGSASTRPTTSRHSQ